MIAAWALYCVVVSGLLALAAWAGALAQRGLGRPERWVWAGAIAGSLALPLVAWWGPGSRAGDVAQSAAVAVPVLDLTPVVVEWASAPGTGTVASLLGPAWLLSSVVFAVVLGASVVRLHRARRRWRRGEVGGREVLISTDTGPAALGVGRGEIVVPAWVLTLDERLRELLLLHEAEHLRAGDPRLLVAALTMLVAMPWNPVLWWQFRRLREAMELDCDARVLRQVPDVRGYGTLLLEVGRRRCRGGLAVASMSRPESFLERRIRMLRTERTTSRPWRALAGFAAAVGLVIAACEAPEPTMADLGGEAKGEASLDMTTLQSMASEGGVECEPLYLVDGVRSSAEAVAALVPDGIASVEVIKGAAGRLAGAVNDCGVVRVTTMQGDSADTAGQGADQATAPEMSPPRLMNPEEVARLLESAYPPPLREAGIGGTATMTFRIDASGVVTGTALVESSGHPELDAAAEKVARTIRFHPATSRDEPIPIIVRMPITFRAQAYAVRIPYASPSQ